MVRAPITPIHRGTIRTDLNRLVEGFSLGSRADPDPETPMVEGPVYNLVVDHPEATILWDTGSHPDAGDGHWPAELYDAFEHYDAADHPLDDQLAAAGYGIDDVDAVVQSHLHLDHAGGLHHFDGTDVPVYVHEAELKHAYYSTKTDEGDPAYVLDDFDHDLNWQVVHRSSETHFEDLEFVHLPGHTPGLMGFQLEDDARGTVLVAGDEAYSRLNYDEELPLGAGLLWSERDWWESLRELKDRERRTDATVVCGHDADDFERLEGAP
ncbi:N-acyl homoserine lactonase family protein [Halospeciosus flavus]|uniref:N-acyl homoserine lactonase family protein n=1 Tax=Halospeciosus flavus TaxID=3032283 RepID=A0ABD5Z0N5_9EURY|nr:N-acyl homoserine lactonase family protein [Halospeciosus flavus]